MRILFLSAVLAGLFVTNLSAQTNWLEANTFTSSKQDSLNVWRRGSVAISKEFKDPYNNKLFVSDNYNTVLNNNRAAMFTLNSPRWDLYTSAAKPISPTVVPLATDPLANYQAVVIHNYANFKEGITFSDVHNTSLEVGYDRGTSDNLGFRDGGNLLNAYTARFSGTVANNLRAHITQNFDILNLRFFTGSQANSPAVVKNFYGLRLEDLRGSNLQIIENGWGVYIAPPTLRNHFAGKTGIGTTDATHQLTVTAAADPLRLTGLQNSISDTKVLTVSADGVVHQADFKAPAASATRVFLVTTDATTLQQNIEIYVHKGGDVNYTLPPPTERTGKTWKIVNIGSGSITFSIPYYEGSDLRRSVLNVPGSNSIELFSTGEAYIKL